MYSEGGRGRCIVKQGGREGGRHRCTVKGGGREGGVNVQ